MIVCQKRMKKIENIFLIKRRKKFTRTQNYSSLFKNLILTLALFIHKIIIRISKLKRYKMELLASVGWFLLKILLALLVAYIVVICFFHFRAVQRLNFYEKQGAVIFPGAKRFFFGNNLDMIDYSKMRA